MAGRHPNIVQLLEVFATEHHLAIVMEYASNGDLSELIDSRGNEEVPDPYANSTNRLLTSRAEGPANDHCI